jgi:hypothetical protein
MQGSELYFRFLRYCLEENPSGDFPCQGMDWQGLHDFAVKHAIVGVVFRGVERLGKDAGVPKELLFNWFAESGQIRQRNSLVNSVATELSQRFTRDGFRCCILKGQGNAMMYPDPSARTPGDIDVWLEGSRKDILAYVRSVSPNAPFQYHHVDFPKVRDVSIEVHFMPSFFSNPLQNRRMQAYFREHADAQFSHRVTLPGCTDSVAVPTDSFNRVYQMTHIMRHLFDEGIGIRQLVDYYYLLKKGLSDADRKETADALRMLKMEQFTSAIMYVLHELLGLEERHMLVAPDGRRGRAVLSEVLHTGNFGQYEDRFTSRSNTGRGFAATVMRRLPFLVRQFPVETLSRPLFLAWYPIWKLRYKQ